jgi:carbamoyl-phosphate synthase large subunit
MAGLSCWTLSNGKMRIIVLNCYSRNSLAVINSLRPGYELIGGTPFRKDYPIIKYESIFRSSRLKEIFRYADPVTNSTDFKNDLVQACKFYQPDAVIPTGTTITNYLSFYKKEIVRHTDAVLLVDDYPKLHQLTDKWLTYKMCLENKISVPRTSLFEYSKGITSFLNNFHFPLVLKPRISYAAKGVIFLSNPEALKNFLRRSRQDKMFLNGEPSYIIQEGITGELHDVTCLAKDGRAISIMSQQRLVSLYDFGGGGIINRTTYEPVPMKMAEMILQYTKWNGVLLFDFIKDKEDNYYLLECNPKIWGTTQLTVDAGLNVVQQLVDVFVSGKEADKKDIYEIGLVYKWLFPECVFHCFQNPRTLKQIAKRIAHIFIRYDGTRTLHNLKVKDFRHLIGTVLERVEL